MWSILTMPAILRNSLPNLLPSISNIGSYAVVDAIVVVLGSGGHRVYGPNDSAVSVGVMSCVRAVIVWARDDDDRTTMPACSPRPAPGPPVRGLIRLCVLARSVSLCVIYTPALSRPLCRPSNGLLPLAIPQWQSI